MPRYIPIVLFLMSFIPLLQAQETSPFFEMGGTYALKGGLTLANQRWNNLERNTLPSYHVALDFASAGEWRDGNKRSIFGLQLGYFRRGSAIRVEFIDPNNPNNFFRRRLEYPFHNLSIMPYAKGQHLLNEQTAFHYGLGLRGEYTLAYRSPFIDFDRFVNRFNYGLWVGGGMQWALGQSPLGLIIELSVSPDLSRQIFVPPGIPIQYTDPSGSIQSFPSQEQRVFNLCFELSIGLVLNRPRSAELPEDF